MPTDRSLPEKPTPIAMPSGKLCSAMENTIDQTRRNCTHSGRLVAEELGAGSHSRQKQRAETTDELQPQSAA